MRILLTNGLAFGRPFRMDLRMQQRDTNATKTHSTASDAHYASTRLCVGVLSCHTSIDNSCTPATSDHIATPSLAAEVGCTHAAIAMLSTVGASMVLAPAVLFAMSSTTALSTYACNVISPVAPVVPVVPGHGPPRTSRLTAAPE